MKFRMKNKKTIVDEFYNYYWSRSKLNLHVYDSGLHVYDSGTVFFNNTISPFHRRLVFNTLISICPICIL